MSMAAFTISLAFCTGFTIAVLIALMMVVIVVLILFHTLLAEFLILLSVELINSLMAFHTFVMIVLMAVITDETVALMAFQTLVNVWLIAVSTVLTVTLMPSITPVKNRARASQSAVKNSLIAVHASFQVVPNQERITSAMPLIVLRAISNSPFIPSQMEEKISLMPCHTSVQWPVNRAC